MDKPNIFRSNNFFMDAGDVLHILVKDLTGTGVTIGLNDSDGNEEDNEPIGFTTTLVPTTTLAPSPLMDKDGNEYTSVQIGTQEWIIENYRTTTYGDGTPIPNIIHDTQYVLSDYFMPSLDELVLIYTNLIVGAGDPCSYGGTIFWSSSEASATQAYEVDFTDGSSNTKDKSNFAPGNIMACRTYIKGFYYYEIGDVGEGGWIYDKSDNGDGTATYYECTAIIDNQLWSNITNVAIGTTSTDVGEGQNNTNEIIAQAGHTLSAASQCDDYSVNSESGWGDDTSGAYCWYANNIANKSTYGALYNWYAVDYDIQIGDEGEIEIKGLEYLERDGTYEAGWRVPTETDFTTLSTFLGGDLISGGKLKEVGTTHWSAPNTGATDNEGFMAMPSGIRLSTGTFLSIGESLEFGTSTESSPTELMAIGLSYDSAETVFDPGGKAKGYAIRLVRDI